MLQNLFSLFLGSGKVLDPCNITSRSAVSSPIAFEYGRNAADKAHPIRGAQERPGKFCTGLGFGDVIPSPHHVLSRGRFEPLNHPAHRIPPGPIVSS